MNATTYNAILNVYTQCKTTRKVVRKNDVFIQSLFNSGATFTNEQIDLFFKIKNAPQIYFFNQMFKVVDAFESGSIEQGRKKVGMFMRFDNVKKDININELLINDSIIINKVGMNYAPELISNTCYCFFS
jgi:hypothetical protein